MAANSKFTTISDRIKTIQGMYPSLKSNTDDYVFSAVCIKYSIYKNPALILNEIELNDAIVDGTADGGADFLLLDPNNSEASDLIIGQAKYWSSFTAENAKNAVNKMIDFFQKMRASDFNNVRPEVVSRFQKLYAETGDESKFVFALYVSAPQNSIKLKTLKKIVEDRLGDEDRFELRVFFGSDVEDEIREAESRRPYVEKGFLKLDEKGNCLEYGEDAAIVNISANSLKKLYATHLNNLLSMNLRFFTKKQDIDSEIKLTMSDSPDSFWYKNNGITIICEDYDVDGRELKLKNFSIINGGQTTYLIYKNGPTDEEEDFYIVCKVIRAQGNTQEEKDQFILDIAKATNSQKAIKDTDLKANSKEQLSFGRAMREKGVYYKTKRGEDIPSNYKKDFQHTDYPGTGKLYLAGIFQLPAKSRNKPSTMKEVKYYNPIFLTKDQNSSGLIRDLLYVDSFFRNTYIPEFDKKHAGNPILSFANNSRTICIAFVGLAARLLQNNIDGNEFVRLIGVEVNDSYYEDSVYPKLKKFDEMTCIIKPSAMNGNKDVLDEKLSTLFEKLIREGYKAFNASKVSNSSLVESNYLKKDSSYYQILSGSWMDLMDVIESCKDIFV